VKRLSRKNDHLDLNHPDLVLSPSFAVHSIVRTKTVVPPKKGLKKDKNLPL
jgi:hypothetical protein